MEELKNILMNIDDSYYGFVAAVMTYAGKKQERLDSVMRYIRRNPDAGTSDILFFISEQTDFYEDASYAHAV